MNIFKITFLAVLVITMGICLTLFCHNRIKSYGDVEYNFTEPIAPFEMDAGHALSEEEYLKIIEDNDAALFTYLHHINHFYMRIASKEYKMKYPDSASANAWYAYTLLHRNQYIDDNVMMILPYMQEMEDTPAIPSILFRMFIFCYNNSHNNYNRDDSWWNVSDNSICSNRKEAYARLCTYWARRIPDDAKGPNSKEWAGKEYSDEECEHVWASFVAKAIDNSLRHKKFWKRATPSEEQWAQSVLRLKNELKTAKGKRRKSMEKILKEMTEWDNPEDQEQRLRREDMRSFLSRLAIKRKNDRTQITAMIDNLERVGAPMQSQIPNYGRLVKKYGKKEADLLDAYYIAYISGQAREVMSRIEKMNQRDERVLWLKHDCQCALLRPLEECIPTLDAILKRNSKDKRAQELKQHYIRKLQGGK